MRRDGDDLPITLEAMGLNGLRVALFDADQERASTAGAWLRSWGCSVVNELDLDAAHTSHAAQGQQAQAIVCAWQGDAPLWAGQRIQALRAGNASQIPACIIYADLGASDKVPNLPAATAVLGQPLQAAQLRAWLRRVVQS